jgi:Zn-dependent protease
MFIPGLGAFVRLQSQPATPREDARIGLAGPLWGLGAAVAALVVAFALQSRFWSAVAQTTAVINLFNLTPVWSLDGARGFRALSKGERWMFVALLAAAFAISRERMLIVVALGVAWAAFHDRPQADGDRGALARFAVLVLALSAIAVLPPAGR